MKLDDLPTMLVERFDRTADGLKVYGRFDRLDGVRENGYSDGAVCVRVGVP